MNLEHDFTIGQWVTCEGVYMQIMAFAGLRVLKCRFAGKKGQWVDKSYSKLTPATLTPNFANHKEGDTCFSPENGFCTMLPADDKFFVPAMNVNGGFDVYLQDGRLTAESMHPTLFNCFAQFQAYWAEEALKIKEENK